MKVKFYIEPFRDVLAVFPYTRERSGHRNDLKTCYSHNGQHSVCAKEYLERCIPATPQQYQPLLEELKSIGYKLEVITPKK